MGIKIFSSSFSEGYSRKSEIEPNPKLFEIKEISEINGHLVAIVLYPNCINFEGKKVLVFKDMKKNELKKIKFLDPHFSEVGIAPFARFQPTEKGIEAAKKLCENL